MKKIIIFFVGLALGTFISIASAALFESGVHDAQPVVGYGKSGTRIYPILVDNIGVIQTN